MENDFKMNNLLTWQDACELLHISASTFYRFVKIHNLKPVRIFGKVYYKKDEIQKLICELGG